MQYFRRVRSTQNAAATAFFSSHAAISRAISSHRSAGAARTCGAACAAGAGRLSDGGTFDRSSAGAGFDASGAGFAGSGTGFAGSGTVAIAGFDDTSGTGARIGLRAARSGAGLAGSATGGLDVGSTTGAGAAGGWGTGGADTDGAVVVTDVVTVGSGGITNCQYANAMSPIPMTTAPTTMPTRPPLLFAVLGGASGRDGFRSPHCRQNGAVAATVEPQKLHVSSAADMGLDHTAGIPPSTARVRPECFTFARRRSFVASIQFASLGSTTPPERVS